MKVQTIAAAALLVACASASAQIAPLPMALCADAVVRDGDLVGDPTEGALVVLAAKGGIDLDGARQQYPRVAEVPFDSDYKFMATFHEMTSERGQPVVRCFVKGAPDVLISRGGSYWLPGGDVQPVTEANRHLALEENDRIAGAGERVMVVARRDFDPSTFDPNGNLIDLVQDLTLLAMVGIVDPPRAEAKAAIAKCHSAGIQVRMITGDHAVTAAAIGHELGIEGKALTGAQFAALSDADLTGEHERLEPRTRQISHVAGEHAVEPGLEADLALAGMSAFAGKLGTKVAADGVTIIDDGTLHRLDDGSWRWTGAEPAVFRPPYGVERLFCPLCGSPIARLNAPGILAALDVYPWGCTEQITSKALPLIYFDQVAQAAETIVSEPIVAHAVDDRAHHAIDVDVGVRNHRQEHVDRARTVRLRTAELDQAVDVPRPARIRQARQPRPSRLADQQPGARPGRPIPNRNYRRQVTSRRRECRRSSRHRGCRSSCRSRPAHGRGRSSASG